MLSWVIVDLLLRVSWIGLVFLFMASITWTALDLSAHVDPIYCVWAGVGVFFGTSAYRFGHCYGGLEAHPALIVLLYGVVLWVRIVEFGAKASTACGEAIAYTFVAYFCIMPGWAFWKWLRRRQHPKTKGVIGPRHRL